MSSIDNARHYTDFKSVRETPAYRAAVIAIDGLLGASPVLILNFQVQPLNDNWYFLLVVLAFASCVDPLLCLSFGPHKLTAIGRRLRVLQLLLSGFIALLALVLPMQASMPGRSLEQTNDLLFIALSLLCFAKALALLVNLLKPSRVLRKVFSLLRNLAPFLLRTLVSGLVACTGFFLIGQLLFGGRVNSFSITQYEEKSDLTIKPGYIFFHFNDAPSGFFTLFALLLQNNWTRVAELLFSARPGWPTVTFLVTFNFLVTFVLTALLLGVTARLIAAYFENDFKENKQDVEKVKQRNQSVSSQLSDAVVEKNIDRIFEK